MAHVQFPVTLVVNPLVRDKAGNNYQVMRMPDGKAWTTENIAIDLSGSFYYDNLKSNGDRYVRAVANLLCNAPCTFTNR